ncbi:MAG: ATP-binding cassette domain-containing protein [Vampirovibrionales bacterium]|nr:ATP-binding cassette domain-containing protein [Vampirovibrionales bacterium]
MPPVTPPSNTTLGSVLIQVDHLTQRYNSDGAAVLDDISLSVRQGELLAVIGPSGCGKSTLLRSIAGLESPTQGQIHLDNDNLAMVFQYSALFDWLTVLENVAFSLLEPGEGRGKPAFKSADDPRLRSLVQEKLAVVGLEGAEDKMPNELSGGMQKRVSFARAIMSHPSIILYDEPTSGLDPISTATLEDYMQLLQQQLQPAAIVVTHQLSTVTRIANRVIMLDKGKICFDGTPQELLKCHQEPMASFVQAAKAV